MTLTPEKVAELQGMGELLSKWGLALDGVTVVAKSMGREVPKELFRASLTVGVALPSLLAEREELLAKVERLEQLSLDEMRAGQVYVAYLHQHDETPESGIAYQHWYDARVALAAALKEDTDA